MTRQFYFNWLSIIQLFQKKQWGQINILHSFKISLHSCDPYLCGSSSIKCTVILSDWPWLLCITGHICWRFQWMLSTSWHNLNNCYQICKFMLTNNQSISAMWICSFWIFLYADYLDIKEMNLDHVDILQWILKPFMFKSSFDLIILIVKLNLILALFFFFRSMYNKNIRFKIGHILVYLK